MPADRFYLDQPLTSPLIIHGEELHHLHVMRIRSGEKIEIVNGRGELVEAQVEGIDKKEATLKIVSHVKKQPPTQKIILAQALPRFSALEWVVEKGTELGVTEFWLFPGNLSEKTSLTPTQLQRLQMMTISALKQCGRLFLPQILIKPPLVEWQKIEGSLFYGDVQGTAPLAGPFLDRVFFIIGPEKGLASTEIEKLQTLGAKAISLHVNTLRTETAAIAALSQFYLISSLS
jgi:16S rRNA (uracil1498-N3)-methyltransferase